MPSQDTNQDIGVYPRVATPITILGSSIVFLLTCAALGNAAVRHLVLPDALHRGAVIAHLSSVLLALPLGVSQLVLPKGTMRHRTVGYIWCALMVATALVSFAVHEINPGGLSPIHIFSVVTLVVTPLIIFNARTGNIQAHQRSVLGLMLGGLVLAGLFTFIPSRALGSLVVKLFNPH